MSITWYTKWNDCKRFTNLSLQIKTSPLSQTVSERMIHISSQCFFCIFLLQTLGILSNVHFSEVLNYKIYDPELFRADLHRIPWDIIELESDPDNAWNSLKDLFMTAADCNAPVVNRRERGRSLLWITPTIKNLMKKRDYQHKSYKRLRIAVSMKLRKEKASYYSNQLCEKQDSCKLWKTLNELLPNKKQHKTANASVTENLTATSFNEFFASVAEKLCGHYKSKNLCTSEIASVVQDDLNRVVQWMESSRLILNQSKTKSMLFGSWHNLAKSSNFCIQLYGEILKRLAKFSYLCDVLDENLSWKDHVEYISSKVSRRLGLLSRIRSCLTLRASKQVYTSLLQPLFQRVLQRVTPPTKPRSSNYITEKHLKWHFVC